MLLDGTQAAMRSDSVAKLPLEFDQDLGLQPIELIIVLSTRLRSSYILSLNYNTNL